MPRGPSLPVAPSGHYKPTRRPLRPASSPPMSPQRRRTRSGPSRLSACCSWAPASMHSLFCAAPAPCAAPAWQGLPTWTYWAAWSCARGDQWPSSAPTIGCRVTGHLFVEAAHLCWGCWSRGVGGLSCFWTSHHLPRGTPACAATSQAPTLQTAWVVALLWAAYGRWSSGSPGLEGCPGCRMERCQHLQTGLWVWHHRRTWAASLSRNTWGLLAMAYTWGVLKGQLLVWRLAASSTGSPGGRQACRGANPASPLVCS